MYLENIMLIKITQSQKTAYCMIAFIRNIQNKHIYKDRK